LKSTSKPVKVLASGEIESSISISANAFSQKAIQKIEKAGGKAIVI